MVVIMDWRRWLVVVAVASDGCDILYQYDMLIWLKIALKIPPGLICVIVKQRRNDRFDGCGITILYKLAMLSHLTNQLVCS